MVACGLAKLIYEKSVRRKMPRGISLPSKECNTVAAGHSTGTRSGLKVGCALLEPSKGGKAWAALLPWRNLFWGSRRGGTITSCNSWVKDSSPPGSAACLSNHRWPWPVSTWVLTNLFWWAIPHRVSENTGTGVGGMHPIVMDACMHPRAVVLISRELLKKIRKNKEMDQ